jgi:hypothetical protein
VTFTKILRLLSPSLTLPITTTATTVTPPAKLPLLAELARTLTSLGKDDWPEIFHTLNSVRRLALHHSALVEGSAHEIVTAVLKQAENLRSQVAKNALLTVGDLWRGLGRALDAELPLVAPLLIKKYADKVSLWAAMMLYMTSDATLWAYTAYICNTDAALMFHVY